MKKFLAAVLSFAMAFSLVACGGTEKKEADTPRKTDVAFITDTGNIDDQSFNQYTWAGVQEFGKKHELSTNYYKPSEDSDAARIEQMDNAIRDGAKAVVMAGYLFANSLAVVQKKYPEVTFVAADMGLGDLAEPAKNTALISYRDEQAGYLAGFSAVKDGYKRLGFLGGVAVPAVIRFGYGFVQGADAAARQEGISDVSIRYWYSGSFTANDDIKAKMDSWYSDFDNGTEVIFACGGSICNSCIAAAQVNDGKMIGVDIDQSVLDPCVITSALKELSASVQIVLEDSLFNGWKLSDQYAGKESKLGAAEGCVGLPMETSKFRKFTVEDYEKLMIAMSDGSLVVDSSYDSAVKPAVTNVTVDYQD